MRDFSKQKVEYAVGRLDRLRISRNMTQSDLEHLSGVKQSTVSKILSRAIEPSEEVLTKLFLALGLKLSDILNESDRIAETIHGYLATPLTFAVRDGNADAEIRRIVKEIKAIAGEKKFEAPRLEIYWPGDFTHPIRHAAMPANQVYITDRSRASTFDFVILFCAAASYGVGQESEIVTQAGVPAIRLIKLKDCSRMMTGSFLRAVDVEYSGTLETRIDFDAAAFRSALRTIRQMYFRQRGIYRGLNGDDFGERLRRLVNDRCGNYEQFAYDLGISLTYLHTLMDEPFAVSNPSARLLKRMSVLLCEPVGYLLGESDETDTVWIESNAHWRAWIANASSVDAKIALEIHDEWRDEYRVARREQPSSSSHRKPKQAMSEIDWDKRYQRKVKTVNDNAKQTRLL